VTLIKIPPFSPDGGSLFRFDVYSYIGKLITPTNDIHIIKKTESIWFLDSYANNVVSLRWYEKFKKTLNK